MTYKTGDRVKVTLTATVASGPDEDNEIRLEVPDQVSGLYINPDLDGVEVEKIERPYKVGDVVRRADGLEWTLGNKGYLVTKEGSTSHALGNYHEYVFGSIEDSFPTGSLELVSSVED